MLEQRRFQLVTWEGEAESCLTVCSDLCSAAGRKRQCVVKGPASKTEHSHRPGWRSAGGEESQG